MDAKSPVILIILDGWGYNAECQHNAIAAARTPQWEKWWATMPHILVDASGQSVGLPLGQMGNSEVGHMHIGAGRVIEQDFTRINHAIASGEFKRPLFIETLTELKKTGKALHVMGLLSEGGVHSHEAHLFAFLKLCHEQRFNRVYLHLFLDGRDTPPRSARQCLEALNQQLQQYPSARIASISGRYFAMDRDKRWERTQSVYDMLTLGQGEAHFDHALSAIDFYYQQQKTDEFIPPTTIGECPIIADGDALFFFNFRSDRARQLTQAFIDPAFSDFARRQQPKLSRFISMTRYAKSLPTDIAFPPLTLNNTLGEVLADNGLTQLRIAETEKYAHVTFFLNGGNETVFQGEDRILVPSPPVATYDLVPQMSANELTNALVDAIKSEAFDVIVCNFANADMVGHTGNFPATVKAIECLDHCLKRLWQALEPLGGSMLITADHGNAEVMFNDKTEQAHTAHTSGPVPLLYIGEGWHFNVKEGSLIDIAPTLLRLLDLKIPNEMTGRALLEKNNA